MHVGSRWQPCLELAIFTDIDVVQSSLSKNYNADNSPDGILHQRYPLINFMGLNILFWNCQGIRSKRKELELYLKENEFDIVALNETFFNKKVNFRIPRVMILFETTAQLARKEVLPSL